MGFHRMAYSGKVTEYFGLRPDKIQPDLQSLFSGKT